MDRSATPVVAPPLSQLPNALTIARFALIPLFVVLVLRSDEGYSIAAAVVFAAAGITDQVDDFLARRWHVESEFRRKLADPLADRLMIDAAIVLLWLEGRLPWPALAIILLRDVVLVAGSRYAITRGYVFEVSFLGKAATWILYAAIVLVNTRTGRHGLAACHFLDRCGPGRDSRCRVRRQGGEDDPMKAVVMAGGEGTRLRSRSRLASQKPMVPIVGRPCMEHIVALLKLHGIEDVLVTLAFMPQSGQDILRRRRRLPGVRMQYSVEESPAGTAGSVGLAAEALDDTFLVISGDALCDVDLSALVEFHKGAAPL